VTDAGLKELAPLAKLTHLNLWTTKVTDAGLAELAPLKNLTHLNLMKTEVTDAGLAELAPLTELTNLTLGDTKVTDAGLKQLTAFKKLAYLYLNRTGVTDAGLKELSLHKNLGAARHVLVVREFLARCGALIAGLGAHLANSGRISTAPSAQRRRNFADVGAIDAGSHGRGMSLFALGKQRRAVLEAHVALHLTVRASLGALQVMLVMLIGGVGARRIETEGKREDIRRQKNSAHD
jgi:hypothetical protein